jgi:adenosylhomocysteine nucleosidase
MAVLLIAAEALEFAGLLKYCRNVKPLSWPVHWARTAQLNGRELWMAANGAGGLRAAQVVDIAKAAGGPEVVCSVGFCGGLNPDLKAGDIFVAERVQTSAGEYAVVKPQSPRAHHIGVLASIDRVAQTVQEKAELRARGAAAVEMEAGGVVARAAELGLEACCVRAVTDLAGESFGMDFNSMLREDGRFGTMRLIAAACRRPLSTLPELWRLGKRSRLASRNLGEFIAHCRF